MLKTAVPIYAAYRPIISARAVSSPRWIALMAALSVNRIACLLVLDVLMIVAYSSTEITQVVTYCCKTYYEALSAEDDDKWIQSG